jgi:hypothetical protein
MALVGVGEVIGDELSGLSKRRKTDELFPDAKEVGKERAVIHQLEGATCGEFEGFEGLHNRRGG